MKHPASRHPEAEAFARRVEDAIQGRAPTADDGPEARADLLLARRLAGLRQGGVAPTRPPWLDRPAEQRRRLAWLPASLPGLRLAPVLLALVAVLGLARLATLERWSDGADGVDGTNGTDGTYRTHGTDATKVPQEPAATPATDRPSTPIGRAPTGGPADEAALSNGSLSSYSSYRSHPEATATHHPTAEPPPHPTAPHRS